MRKSALIAAMATTATTGGPSPPSLRGANRKMRGNLENVERL